MMILENQMGIELKVGGENIPLGPGNLESISIMQNMQNISGVAEFAITDTMNKFENGIFSDQAPVELALGPAFDGQIPPTQSFRLFNIQEVFPTTSGTSIKFTAVFNAPELFRKPMSKAYKGTSAEAIGAMARDAGVQFETTGTADSMTWLPNSRPFGQAMRKIADHGSAGGTSAMHLTMGTTGDGQWKLMYKDLIAQLQSEGKAKFISLNMFTGEGFPIFHVKGRNHSGTLNSQLSGGSIIQTKLSGKTEIDSLFEAMQSTAKLNINMAVKDAIGKLPPLVAPFDGGNTHKDYTKAQMQNEKLKGTLSGFLDCVTNYFTNVAVMDPVDVLLGNGEQINQVLSGRYIVNSRTQFVKGHLYREKLTLASQGSNK